MSSPFTSKLGTNYCPQDREIFEIKMFLVDPIRRLQRLDDEITDLRKALEKLAAERDSLDAYVDAHRALISPVRRLPLDIIQEIFIACIPTHRNCVMSASEAPLLLGRVCGLWRTISLSTPRLWSRLHVVEPLCISNSALAQFEEKMVQRVETTKTWLGRSGQCPLSISLQCAVHVIDFPSATQDLLQALLPFASRWEHISFTTSSSVLATTSHLTEADVPMLRLVNIREYPTGNPEDTVPWDSLGFLRALEISLFSVFCVGISSPLDLPLRWNGLTDLSLVSGWSSEISLMVISRCPQLRTCRLAVDFAPENGNRIGEPNLELSFLHTLDIKYYGNFSNTVGELFTHLFLPQLRHLKLRGALNYADEISYSPLSAAAPLIESLELGLELFSRPSLADFLREIPPTVREISIVARDPDPRSVIEDSFFDDEMLESLTPSPDLPTPRCPGLQVLEIDHPCSFSDEALLRFIKSRMLTRVVLRLGREMEFDLRPELQPLIQSGLHLALTYDGRQPAPAALHLSPWEGLLDAPNFLHNP
ncbi:hypothetical protein DFH09DRAFT_1032412 [Mycena vulgaris]|nr:hypothetical protein DFH09DRAFT_1032412 [Mycena vulgaris]